MTFCAILNGTLTGQTLVGTLDKITVKKASADSTYIAELKVKTIDATAAAAYYAYTLADGSIVAFDPNGSSGDGKSCTVALGEIIDATWITNHTNCLGFIDVNGSTLPNTEVSCTTGTTSKDLTEACTVANNATNMTDVFPIVFHDATVEPVSNAAKYVLTSSKY